MRFKFAAHEFFRRITPAMLNRLLPPTCLTALAAVSILTAGCAEFKPYIPPSQGHISAPAAKPEIEAAIPPPARVSTYVPPPKPAVKPQTYSVVVNEVPVKELLLALARDTKQNIDIHPGISGLVSLNAINETLPAILDRISKQVNLRYRTEGNTMIVSLDAPHVKTYRVNYVNMSRDTTSSVGVTGEISTSSGAPGSGSTQSGLGSGTQGGSGSSGSNTVVRTITKNDFWEQLRDNIHAILISTRRIATSAEERAEHAQRERASKQDALKAAEAASRAGAGAGDLLRSIMPASRLPSALASTDVGKDVVVNPITGTITVLATEQQHQLIQHHIDSIVSAAQRQVLIEATIVEVQLSEQYQGGVDWTRLAISGGITFAQSLLGGFGAGLTQAGANFFRIGYTNPNSALGNINATVKLLQEFGNARVLSSPKMMALNNQTAMLKVVDNLVYFEVQTTAGIAGAGGVITSPSTTTTAKTVAIGVVMAVTPQVNEDGRVSLIVRPTVTRLNPTNPFVNDPNPELSKAGQINPVPQVQTREMESVLQVGSGQTAILGGLMQDDAQFRREQLPGVDAVSQRGGVGGLGDIFRFRTERAVKTELIVFLRPTVIANATLEGEELKLFKRLLPQHEQSPPGGAK